MTLPSVTYPSFTSRTTIESAKVNKNFKDVIDGITDGTKALNVATMAAKSLYGSDALNLGIITSPASASAGTIRVYPKADGSLYTRDSVGSEKKIGSDGSGATTPTATDALSIDGQTLVSGNIYLIDMITAIADITVYLPAWTLGNWVKAFTFNNTDNGYRVILEAQSGEQVCFGKLEDSKVKLNWAEQAITFYADDQIDHKRYLIEVIGTVSSSSPSPVVPEPLETSIGGAIEIPIISRSVPAFASSGTAADGQDTDYVNMWHIYGAVFPGWLAYDLSGVSAPNRTSIMAHWMSDGQAIFDMAAVDPHEICYSTPGPYKIQGNAAAGGGACPSTGWVDLVVSPDPQTKKQLQHLINFTGYNWIRFYVIEQNEYSVLDGCRIKFDIYDVSSVAAGATGDWLFMGDSITAGVWHNANPFATKVNAQIAGYFPVARSGGVGATDWNFCSDILQSVLDETYCKFVSLAYGTNDTNWGDFEEYPEMLDPILVHVRESIEIVIADGKVPIIPKIPWCNDNATHRRNVQLLNAAIAGLTAEYSQLVIGPDFYTLFENHSEWLYPDGIHPTDDGNDQMTTLWADWAVASLTAQTAPVYGTLTEQSIAITTALRGSPNFLMGCVLGIDQYEIDFNVDLFYRYLTGGYGNAGWPGWNANGGYIDIVCGLADGTGVVPMFTYYQMALELEWSNWGFFTGADIHQYLLDWKLLFTRLAVFNKPAVVHIEPDFFGYLQQYCINNNTSPNLMTANIHYVDVPESVGLPATVVGLMQTIITMARTIAPKVKIGYMPSQWGDFFDLAHTSNGVIIQKATSTATFLRSLGSDDTDFVAIETSDRDAGYWETHGRTDCYWDATNATQPNFANHLLWVSKITELTNRPALWWQTPYGLPSGSSGTDYHYRDNRTTYFFAHVDQLIAAGGFGVCFGAGSDLQTMPSTDSGDFLGKLNAYKASPTVIEV